MTGTSHFTSFMEAPGISKLSEEGIEQLLLEMYEMPSFAVSATRLFVPPSLYRLARKILRRRKPRPSLSGMRARRRAYR